MTLADVILRSPTAEDDKWVRERMTLGKDEKFHFKVRQDEAIPVN